MQMSMRLSFGIYIYIYIYISIYIFFKVQVVIWETLHACYFRTTSLSRTWFLFFFFTKAPHFKWWLQGSPMTCALMVSSLRLLACFIYDKRA